MAYLAGQTYAQSAAGIWTPVGYAPGDLALPVSQRDTNTGRTALISTFQALNAVPLIGLVNSTFFSTTSITDNYTTANTGSATTTVTANDGYAVLASGTTNPSTAQITSKDFSTYNGIGELMFLNGLRIPQLGAAGVIRRWGAYDANNGYFFEDNAGVERVVARKNGVDTAVASGSFNGLIGTTWTNDQNAHFFQILMTGGRAIFMVDQVVLHTMNVPAGQTTTSGSLNLPIRVEVISTQTVNMTLEIRGQNIGRLGTVDSKRLNEGLLDANDAELVRNVQAASTGAANTYVNQTATVVGTKNSLDFNIAASAGGVADVTGTLPTTNLANAAVTADVSLSGNATLTLTGGTYTNLPLIFEASPDNQVSWFTIDGTQLDGTGVNTQFTLPSQSTGARAWNFPTPGYTHLRIRQTAAATALTGAPTIRIKQGPLLYEPSPTVAPIDGQKATYTAFLSGNTANVGGTEVLRIVGSGARTIRLTRLEMMLGTTIATTAAFNIQGFKRSTLSTGATAYGTAPFVGPLDSTDPATSATLSAYTTAPGVAGAVVAHTNLLRAGVLAANAATPINWVWGNRPSKAVVLRGAAENWCLYLPVAITGASQVANWTGILEWTEE